MQRRMDPYEVTRAIYARIRALDPRNVSKIVGYLLLQDHAEQDMLRLALGNESQLLSVVTKAKEELGLFPPPPPPPAFLSHELAESRPEAYPLDPFYLPYQLEQDHISHHVEQQHQKLSPGTFPNEHFYPDTLAFLNRSRDEPMSSYGSPNSSGGGSNSAWKPCVYFSRGFCKHGSACKFLHYQQHYPSSEDEQLPLEKLDLELEELLRSKKSTVPISALPQLYYETFGRPLLFERYLSQSERHTTKAGGGLAKVFSRLQRTVLIDQPYGHRSLILAEDATKFQIGEDGSSPSSRQIYLTFPAESTFSEEDVSAHFSAYGPVQDVRIPYQQKRMFGFVTFLHAETVKVILSENNSHYVCGARVLVKPYREKGKHSTKKAFEHSRTFPNGASTCGNIIASRILQENSLLERKLAELHISRQAELLSTSNHFLPSSLRQMSEAIETSGVEVALLEQAAAAAGKFHSNNFGYNVGTLVENIGDFTNNEHRISEPLKQELNL